MPCATMSCTTAMWLTMYDGRFESFASAMPFSVIQIGLPYDAAVSRTSRNPPGSVGWLKSLHVGEGVHRPGMPLQPGNPGMSATPKPCIGWEP